MNTIGDVLPIPPIWVVPVAFDTSIKTKKPVSVVIGYVPSGLSVPSPPDIEFLIHQLPRSLWEKSQGVPTEIYTRF